LAKEFATHRRMNATESQWISPAIDCECPRAVAENHQVAENFLSLMNHFDSAWRAFSL